MPRKRRERSYTGVYHVYVRGINRQLIYEAPKDYSIFLGWVHQLNEALGMELYAYCLMNNHAHFLIKECMETRNLSLYFARLLNTYACYFNRKYKRSGHLFQDRFNSIPVEDTKYFFDLLVYIHKNPTEAAVVKNLKDYPWSSYHEYVNEPALCNIDVAMDIMNLKPKAFMDVFKIRHRVAVEDLCDAQVIGKKNRILDEDAAHIINESAGVERPEEMQKFGILKRDDIIRICRQKGLAIKQIARLTGIGIGAIKRVKIK